MLLHAWNTGFSLVSLDGGSARNAIPAFATAVVVVPKSHVDEFKKLVMEVNQVLLVFSLDFFVVLMFQVGI